MTVYIELRRLTASCCFNLSLRKGRLTYFVKAALNPRSHDHLVIGVSSLRVGGGVFLFSSTLLPLLWLRCTISTCASSIKAAPQSWFESCPALQESPLQAVQRAVKQLQGRLEFQGQHVLESKLSDAAVAPNTKHIPAVLDE